MKKFLGLLLCFSLFQLNHLNARPFPCGFWQEVFSKCCSAHNIQFSSGPDANGNCTFTYDWKCTSVWGSTSENGLTVVTTCDVLGQTFPGPTNNATSVYQDAANYYVSQLALGVQNINPDWTNPVILQSNSLEYKNAVVFRLVQAGYNANVTWLETEQLLNCNMATGPTLPISNPLEVPAFSCN